VKESPTVACASSSSTRDADDAALLPESDLQGLSSSWRQADVSR
jgi:hypothetical protein